VIATILMFASAAVIFSLGTAHLIFTFVGPKLTPRDPALQVRMSEVSPVITKEATMWSFWIGFNISHSMAAMLFGLIYGFLAIVHSDLLFSSSYLLVVGLLTVGGLFVVGKIYWFSGPFIGIGISLACYIASVIVALA
jgi:hypothetical protein